MRKRPDNRQALEAFIAKKAEIDAMLDCLKDFSDDHFEVRPDEVHWGHVETLERYAELLKRIIEGAFHKSKHAT